MNLAVRHGLATTWAVAAALGAFALVLSASASLAAASKLPGVDACGNGKADVRPRTISFCGDGNFYITRLSWSRWTQKTAAARGVAHQNDCKPFCAAGHFHQYAVSVRLSRPEVCRRHKREFTRLLVRFLRRKPSNVAHSRERYNAGLGCP
jgi:hypothetical protein